MKKLIDDNRPIQAISLIDRIIRIGKDNVKQICPYHENGEMAHVIYFAIYLEGDKEPSFRINGKYVERIDYKINSQQEDTIF